MGCSLRNPRVYQLSTSTSDLPANSDRRESRASAQAVSPLLRVDEVDVVTSPGTSAESGGSPTTAFDRAPDPAPPPAAPSPPPQPAVPEERCCVVCLDASREVVFSCGHLCCCRICSELVDICPVCRQEISARRNAPQRGGSSDSLETLGTFVGDRLPRRPGRGTSRPLGSLAQVASDSGKWMPATAPGGRSYWWNTATREVTWEPPEGCVASASMRKKSGRKGHGSRRPVGLKPWGELLRR
eukprot:TRINITY_DN14067_c0_g1_i1.p1 TRINITY_DN14067_c0_g1~~TRINITY_DN14067_c0_g1_i1.p1  ORF type:complete len:242 (+),score=29.47 TRINITY_DN14067_c0_g1_i1:159-884(+)